MNKNLIFYTAKIISYLFVPPVMNFYIFIIFSVHYESTNFFFSIVISLLFGLIIPVFTFLEFRRKGEIINDDATIKEERTLPYIFAIFFSLTGLILSSLFSLDQKIIMLWMIYLVNSIIIININRFWKISAHAMGVAMPLGAVIYLNNLDLILSTTAILSLVVFSRLYLKVHSFFQLFMGAFIGIMISYVFLKYCL